jgi:hypothetical protein
LETGTELDTAESEDNDEVVCTELNVDKDN